MLVLAIPTQSLRAALPELPRAFADAPIVSAAGARARQRRSASSARDWRVWWRHTNSPRPDSASSWSGVTHDAANRAIWAEHDHAGEIRNVLHMVADEATDVEAIRRSLAAAAR